VNECVRIRVWYHPWVPEELTAHWSLPLDYIRQHTRAKNLDQALLVGTVVCFVGGCTENGGQASIISKAVLGTIAYDYWKDNQSQSICGKVPFTLHVHQATFCFACTGTTNHCTL
jgi:hypothetical protein